ncbi:hypothetical protein E0Z10_g4521 [Xylaria hypoxylon]|uniref:hydroxymethylglutaryl-CoA lyase n=1 Tax=Xylaria hypoxylon TaxID=37992 RepID=A0A4Z0YIT2_9PEZI|nr:hypothetical protein E0Z10_g4521 [Xylaria hypoxylon]
MMASLRSSILLTRLRAPRACSASLRRFATASDIRSQPQPDNRVRIVEVGPRDGLQNEKKAIPVATKIELIERLAKTGVSVIEAGSFVSPKWVPQPDHGTYPYEKYTLTITYHVLLPRSECEGRRGCDAILQKHKGAYLNQTDASEEGNGKPMMELAVFAAATESFSQKNLNCDIATSLERFRDVIQGAKQIGIRARAYISVVLGCPFEGYDVNPHKVAEIAASLLEMGADEISLGDTTGMGTAPRTQELLRCMTAAGIRSEDMAMHFHDTYGQALVNTAVSLERGIRTFDSSVGGLGGCPYSPGATGNVSTENTVYFIESLGMNTGIDLDAMADIGQWITSELGKPNESAVGKAVLGARKTSADASK